MRIRHRALIICIVGIVLFSGSASTAIGFELKIDAVDQALLARTVTLPVYITGDARPFDAFEFLIAYDPDQLKSPVVTLGDYFDDCGWEYFTYQLTTEYCGEGCPTSHIRIIGQADVADGVPFEFDCLEAAGPEEILFNLRFTVVREYDNQGAFLPVRFLWQTCSDNVIAGRNGDSLFLSSQLYTCDYLDGEVEYSGVATDDWTLPSLLGAPDACFADLGLTTVVPAIDYFNGGIYVEEDDANYRGDINVNELAFEIADAVMFTNYFINDLAAFGDHVEASILASDVNGDGEPLTVADLDYLIQVIIGNAVPYPSAPSWAQLNILAEQRNGDYLISVETNVEVGAMLLIFDVAGEVTTPELHNNMDVLWSVESGILRMLVYNIGSESITSGDLMTIPHNGDIDLRSVEAAGLEGYVLHAVHSSVPNLFEVHQNYPNPFTPSTVTPKTTIAISLAEQSDYTVEVFNSLGQRVKTFAGSGRAGILDVVWDGTDRDGRAAASGMYFYKVTIGDRSVTKKMMLWR